MADGEKINIAKAYIEVIPSLEGSQKAIATEMGAVAEPAAKEAGEKSGKCFGEALAKGIKTTSAIIAGALTAATGAAVATGKAFVSAATDVAEYGDSVQKNAQKMNMSYQGYQELSYILSRNGSSIESLKSSMVKLSQAAESNNEAFQALGISQEELASMNPEQLFNATLQGLQNCTDESERMVLATKLLGKSAASELGPTLNMTASEMEEMRQQAHDLGGVLSDEAIEDSAGFNDELLNMKTALTGVKNGMMSQFLPGISQVMKGLSLVFSGKGGVGEIKEGLQTVISNITSLAPQFFSLAQTLIMSLLEGFGPMLPQLATTIFSVINQALVTVVTMLPQLLPAITSGISSIMQSLFECLPIITSSLFQLIGDLVTWLSDTTNIETFVNGIVDLTSQVASQMAEILPVLLPAIVRIIGTVANTLMSPQNIGTLVKAVLQIAGAIFVALVNCVPELINFVVGVFKNIWGYITTFGGDFLKSATKWISDVIVKVAQFSKSIVDKVRGLPGELLNIGKNLVSGLWNGISDKLSWITSKIKSMGSSITSAIKKVFGIHSPSKVWRQQIGQNLGLSIGLGFSDVMSDVKNDMAAEMDGLTGNMTATVQANGVSDPLAGSEVTNYNGGNISINVYGAEGQSVDDLADKIAYKLEDLTRRKAAVFG